MNPALWKKCLDSLEHELSPQQLNTWIRPLHVVEEGDCLRLLAPNRHVLDWVNANLVDRLTLELERIDGCDLKTVTVEIGSLEPVVETVLDATSVATGKGSAPFEASAASSRRASTGLWESFTFENFVEGKSNQLARAASMQVAENPGGAYNPLFLYGGVGLGKTHLMHAIGNTILANNPGARVLYLHAERFVADMVAALQHNNINEFKRHYRTVNALLIDDIQFFAGKERSQEEFFHTFNALLEGQQQIILTCDRYPKEVVGLEERLSSRVGWGLPVAIEPPELETRAAILMSKAALVGAVLPRDVAFLIAQRIRSNVRELEGALRRLIAISQFSGEAITVELAKDSLRDLMAMQDRLVTMENIQKTVCQYYKIRSSDLISKRRTRSIARPRQVAMALSKELTNHSLPEIGEAFGGRDHTTVLHACRKVTELRNSDSNLDEEYRILLRSLNV